MQNTSHAVMAQRVEAKDSPDDFPTPPWATRALVEHVLLKNHSKQELSVQSCLEPACGAGHMSKALGDYFGDVCSSDAFEYGYGEQLDFLSGQYENQSFDWVITNPPFRLASEFVLEALQVAKVGVAILARTVFLESVGRYKAIFQETPPAIFAQFTERVPMIKGRLDRKATTATGYAWLVWHRGDDSTMPKLVWIPPCRKTLERDADYLSDKDQPESSVRSISNSVPRLI